MFLYRQKLDIRELVSPLEQTKKVLVVEPEEYLRALYAYHLTGEDMHVRHCGHFDQAADLIFNFSPHLLVINPCQGENIAAASRFVRKIKENLPFVMVVSIGFFTKHEDVKELMSVGINAHLDRRFSKPQDLVAIVKTLLSYE